MGFSLGSIAGDIVGAVGGVASTLLGNHSAKNESERNRDFQAYMSNTSISRRMADLRNAGLNPLLAVDNASSGASTPSGSQAQIQAFDPSLITALSSAKLQSAEAEKTREEAQNIRNENNRDEAKNELLKKEIELRSAGIDTQKLQQELLKENTKKAKVDTALSWAHKKNVDMNTREAEQLVEWLEFKNSAKYELYDKYPELKDALGFIDDFKGMSVTDVLGAMNYMIRTQTGKQNKEFIDKVKSFLNNVNEKEYIPREIDERRISR